PESPRITPHLVQRREAVVAIERGVLDALGHDCRRELLEARGELRLCLAHVPETQQLSGEGQELGVDVGPAPRRLVYSLSDLGAVGVGHCDTRARISAIHVQRRGDLANRLIELAPGPVALPAVAVADVDER